MLRAMTPVRLSLLVASATAVLVPSAAAKKPKVPSKPQVKILGFSTFPRLGIPAIQAKPGKTLTACYDGYSGQREVNFVWQGWGIPKGTKMGLALWGGGSSSPEPSEPSNADVMKDGFTWSHKKKEKVQSSYGFTFAGGPYGPQTSTADGPRRS
jgi:hypothetical protein